jgi:hypothetical protein
LISAPLAERVVRNRGRCLEEVPHGTLPRFEYKVRRWTDERTEELESPRVRRGILLYRISKIALDKISYFTDVSLCPLRQKYLRFLRWLIC